MTRAVVSRGGVPVRLTDERWTHIVEEHSELAGMREEVLESVSAAERVLLGRENELLAVRRLASGQACVVVYRETSPQDGFVITAFLMTRTASLDRREQQWPPKM